jgi:hypothetical protein
MGNSLHNKIYLGRRGWLASRGTQAMLAWALALGATVALAWAAVRVWR